MGEIKYNGRTYSGLIQANGCFVDTDNVIVSATPFTVSMSYTATQDCYIGMYIVGVAGSDVTIKIDNKYITSFYYNAVMGDGIGYFLKKGQTFSITGVTSQYNSTYVVYGIQQGSPITFLSEYASACYDTNEREVGCWIDGKPLYQKSIVIGSLPNATETGYPHGISNIESVVDIFGIANDANGNSVPIIFANPASNVSQITAYRSGANIYVGTGLDRRGYSGYVTLRYTKTTDTAGSGKLTPTGFETHHYSTNEQIVGTWIDGKPLYERVFTGLSIALNGNDWVYFNDPTYIENVIDFKAFADNSGRLLNCAITEYQRSNTNGIMFSGITGFNRTVNVIVARFTKTTD